MTGHDEPLNREPDGTYITIAQMRFFLNREDGKQMFQDGHQDFWEYYNLCRVYNLVSDMMKDKPECAIMYWDDKQKIVSMGFPAEGKVAEALDKIDTAGILNDDKDDDDDFGDYIYKPWENG